ncbi:MAG: T9SS type A sorting domain-containing protein [Bacteroidetes bacterium]|nr:T9SS type A sorting domain-containing protein [Bacteroidota bacterium]
MSNKSTFVAILVLLPLMGHAQYKGGAEDGYSRNTVSQQNGTPNIFLGGVNDGHSSAQKLGQNPTPGIYTGGLEDGAALSSKAQQNQSPNIYSGSVNDGVAAAFVTGQNTVLHIFVGGNNDGTALAKSYLQNKQPDIYYGGLNDGVASLKMPDQNTSPSIYFGGGNDGVDMDIKLHQNSSNPLPLSLLEFAGVWFNDDALLFWKLASSQALDHFELERSEDLGQHFTTIATLAPNPDPSQPEYRYSDVGAWYLPADILYYRLKAVESNGKFSYSAIAKLKKDKTAPVFAAYPNPTSGRLTIALLNVDVFSEYSYQMLSSEGKLLKSCVITSEHTQVDLRAYPSGTYVLIVIRNGMPVQHFKIILTQ